MKRVGMGLAIFADVLGIGQRRRAVVGEHHPRRVVDEGLGVGHVRHRDVGGSAELRRGGGQSAVRGGRAHERHRGDALGVVDREEQGRPSRHRPPEHVGPLDAQGIEDSDGVARQVGHRVPRVAQRERRRPADVPVVETHDVEARIGDLAAQIWMPAEHVRPQALDQQQRRVAGIAEGVVVERHPFGRGDDGHARLTSVCRIGRVRAAEAL